MVVPVCEYSVLNYSQVALVAAGEVSPCHGRSLGLNKKSSTRKGSWTGGITTAGVANRPSAKKWTPASGLRAQQAKQIKAPAVTPMMTIYTAPATDEAPMSDGPAM